MNKEEWVRRLKHLAVNSKDLTGDVLIAIEETLDNALFVYNHPSFMANGSAGRAIMAEIEEAQKRKALNDLRRRLRQKKYIEVSQDGDRIIALTEAGQARCLEAKMVKNIQELPQDWFCVVAFDIPEDTRITRWQIRHRLRRIGFEPHQLSVWITKKDICDEMSEYIHLIGANKWVTVFKAEMKSLATKTTRSCSFTHRSLPSLPNPHPYQSNP